MESTGERSSGSDIDDLLQPPKLGPHTPRGMRRLWIILAGFFLLILLVIGAGGYLFVRYGPKVYYIPSEAMSPTLLVDDRVLADRLAYRNRPPSRGDIIVFNAPRAADFEHGHTTESVLVKRVTAVGGDTLQLRTDARGVVRLCLNGRPVEEPYIKEPMEDYEAARYASDEPLKLGPNELFVMGDNRNNSNDSRFWGPLPTDRVIGRVVSILAPENRRREFP